MTEKPLMEWMNDWIRKESLPVPHVGYFAKSGLSFINQMYQLYKDVDVEKATPLEKMIFCGICDYFQTLEDARRELDGKGPRLVLPFE